MSLLNELKQSYVIKAKSWSDISEVEADEWDLKMLQEIEENPECHEFKSSEEWKADGF